MIAISSLDFVLGPMEVLIFASLVIIGFHAATRKGYILHRFSLYFADLHEEDAKQDLINSYNQEIVGELGAYGFLLSATWDASKFGNMANSIRQIVAEYDNDIVHAEANRKKAIQKIKTNFWERMLFHLSNPWSECVKCMSSIWGGGVLLLHYTEWLYVCLWGVPIVFMPFCILAICGLNAIFERMTY